MSRHDKDKPCTTQQYLDGLARIHDRSRINRLRYNQTGQLSRTLELSMEASNEFVSGTATWVRRANVWSCTKTSGELRFLIGKSRDAARMELLRRGFRWTFSPFPTPAGVTAGNNTHVPEYRTGEALDPVAKSVRTDTQELRR